MERHNGSKKKGWPQKGCEEGRTQSRKEGRQKEGNEKEGHPQAPITTALQKKESRLRAGFLVFITANNARSPAPQSD